VKRKSQFGGKAPGVSAKGRVLQDQGHIVRPVGAQHLGDMQRRSGADKDGQRTASDLIPVTTGAVQRPSAPAFGKAGDRGQAVGDAAGRDHAARRDITRTGAQREGIGLSGQAGDPMRHEGDGRTGRQVVADRGKDVPRRAAVPARHAMRGGRGGIARLAGVEHQRLPAGAAQLQGGGQPGKAAADDRDVPGFGHARGIRDGGRDGQARSGARSIGALPKAQRVAASRACFPGFRGRRPLLYNIRNQMTPGILP
jgi:hypothetical protein